MKNKTKNIIIIIMSLIIISFLIFLFLNKNKNKNIFNLSNENTQINESENIDIYDSTSTVSVDESNDFYTIKAIYPNDPIDKEGVLKNKVESIINKDKEDWKIGGDIWNSEQDLDKKFPDRPKMKYELNISYNKFISKKNNTVSYTVSVYEFTGGAHGGTNLYTFTFNKDKQLKIEDIVNFNNNNDIALTKILKTKLLNVLSKDGQDVDMDMLNNGLGLAFLDKNGILDKSKCGCDGFFFPSNFQNFVILDDGIKFIMGQYAVAAYVYGMPEAIISFDELKPYLIMFNN